MNTAGFSISNRQFSVSLVLFTLLVLIPSRHGYGQFAITDVQREKTLARISFRPAPATRTYELFVHLPGDNIGRPRPIFVRYPGSIVTVRTRDDLDPKQAYVARLSLGRDGPDRNDIQAPIPPFEDNGKNNGGNGGNSGGISVGGGGGGGNTLNQEDALAQRIAAAAEYLRAEGEYLNLRAEARKKVAEAVDQELDNWKKHVVLYFERREENLRSRMRQRGLYAMRQDQTIQLLDSGVRRRYEMMKNHPRLSGGGNYANLNFMLDRFIGTPISYGIPLDEVFDGNPQHSNWELTSAMRRQLRVRTRADGGRMAVFRLDQPHVIDFDWPGILREQQFDRYRTGIEKLNDELTSTTQVSEQIEIARRLQHAIELLSREYFRLHNKADWRGQSNVLFRMQQAEDFLGQKRGELSLFLDNPEQAIRRKDFQPTTDAKDAASLISWMNRSGLRFAKPLPGDDAAYHSVFSMMLELYGLYGEPAAHIPKIDVPVRPSATDKDKNKGNSAFGIDSPLEALDQLSGDNI